MVLADGLADTVASYLEAVGTIAAVVLALFLQVILVRMRRPRITVHELTAPEDEDRVLLPIWTDQEAESSSKADAADYWIRLRVHAQSKRLGATNVQVQVLRVQRPSRANNRMVVPASPFRWSNVWEHVDATLPHLAPGTWRRFDLLHFRWKKGDQGQNLQIPILGFRNPAYGDKQVLLNDPGEYRIEFVLSADGVDASFWRFTFTLAESVAETPEGVPEKIFNTKLEALATGQPDSATSRRGKKVA